VDEVHIGVALQQVAPGALAHVGLARNQQHTQLVAHPVDRDGGAVVDGRQLAFQPRRLDLHDVGAGMGDVHVDGDILSGGDDGAGDDLAVAPHGHGHAGAGGGALVGHAEGQGLALAHDAEAGGLLQVDAPVPLAGAAGDQAVDRCRKAEPGGIGRSVMHAPVGDQDGAGDALRRHVRQASGQGREQAGAIGLAIAGTGLKRAHLDPGNAPQPFRDRRAGGLGLRGPVAEILAGALVHHHRHHRGERRALLPRQGGVGEGRQSRRQRQSAEYGAAGAREQEQRRQNGRHGREADQQRQGNEGVEGEAVGHAVSYCPSRSSRAGTWT